MDAWKRSHACIAACLLIGSPSAIAAPQDVDDSFGDGGHVVVQGDSPGPTGVPTSVGDALYLVAPGNVVTRLTREGVLDVAFGEGGQLPLSWAEPDFLFLAVTPAEDGHLLLAGSVRFGPPVVAKVDARTGDLVRSFGANGMVLHDSGNAGLFGRLSLQHGEIYALGVEAFRSGGGRPIVVRLHSDGTYDSSFGQEGVAQLDAGDIQAADAIPLLQVPVNLLGGIGRCGQARDLVPVGDGFLIAIVTNGNCAQHGDALTLVRIDSLGAQDLEWGTEGAVQVMPGEAVGGLPAVAANGELLVAALAKPSATVQELHLLRLDADGDEQSREGGAIQSPEDDLTGAMALQSDGKLVLSGGAIDGRGDQMTLVRVTGFGEHVASGEPVAGTSGSAGGGGSFGTVTLAMLAFLLAARRRRRSRHERPGS